MTDAYLKSLEDELEIAQTTARDVFKDKLPPEELEFLVEITGSATKQRIKDYKKYLAEEAALPTEEWVLAGTIGVDAGCVTIGDPCYFPVPRREYERLTGLDGGRDNLNSNVKKYIAAYHIPDADSTDETVTLAPADTEYFGDFVTVDSGYGDGSYPVYVKYSDEGSWGKRIKEVRIVFIPDDVEDETDF